MLNEMLFHIFISSLLLTIRIDVSYATVNIQKADNDCTDCTGVTCTDPNCPLFDQYTPDGECCPICYEPEMCSLSRWSHEDQGAWEPDVCQTGQRQSPIDLSCKSHDIKLKTNLVETTSLEESNEMNVKSPCHGRSEICAEENRFGLSLIGFENLVEQPVIINLGNTVEMEISENQYFYAEKLDLSNRAISMYRLAQIHFHWGERETGGTEHTINGHRYHLESHFVFFNVKFESVADAVADGSDDGLLVLGTLYEITEKYNPAMELIAELVRNVQDQVGSHYDFLGAIDLRKLLPFKRLARFFHYMGSLTTPPCTEIVNWFVFKHTLKITETQWEAFKGVLNCEGNEYNNYRDIQDRNDRNIWSQKKVK